MSIKKLNISLDKTWKLCLDQWEYVIDNLDREDNIDFLKDEWLKKNGRQNEKKRPLWGCFFCKYAEENMGIFVEKNDYSGLYCPECPGYKVNNKFHCEYRDSYNWQAKPKKFYKKLKEMHNKYKENNKK